MPLQPNGTADYINVARGLSTGATGTRRPGYNPAIGTTETTVWNETTSVVYPVTAATITLSSSSVNDTAAGTGARTVLVNGLDAGYNTISEIVTLNGQTGVTTVNSYLRVGTLIVQTAGSGGVNAGVIYAGTGTITAGVPATIYSSMAIGFNESHNGFYTVPNGSTAYMLDVSATTDTAGTRVGLYTRALGGVFLLRRINQVGIGGFQRTNLIPLAIPSKSDIEYRALVATGTAKVSALFELLVIVGT